MKLKHFIYSICLAGLTLSSCQKEEDLEGTVDLSSPYVLEDSDDPIDHRRYELYRDYGVAIFFNDTLTATPIGTGYDGKTLYRYETLDLNWDFYNNPKTFHQFTYLETDEEKNLALDYAATYLSLAGKTKPFSILLVKKLVYDNEIIDFHSGFRTLYMSNASSYTEEADKRMKSGEIINSSALPKVKLNEKLIAEFEVISNENHYYMKTWKDLGETFSSDLSGLIGPNLGYNLSEAFDENFHNSVANNMYLSYVIYYNYNIPGISKDMATRFYGHPDAVREACYELVEIAAKYGFICGDGKNDAVYAPNLDQDLEAYVSTILKLGALGFEERYGNFPLVMKKYQMIKAFIEDELECDLDYNNI